nr:DNA mismatch repair protein MutS [uncultured Caproiciproducens sp.]
MKVFLMYRDRDFDLNQELPPGEQALTQDLELNTLLETMALEDNFLLQVAKEALLTSLNNSDTILYRQDILKDCIKNTSVIRKLYDIAVQSLESKKGLYWSMFSHSPDSILYGSVEIMQILMETLKKLKNIADEHADQFESQGFKRFFAMIHEELNDEYLESIRNHLKDLKFSDGVLISAELANGNKGTNYILRKSPEQKQSWVKRMFSQKVPEYAFFIAERDESGMKALSQIRDRGVNLVANALAQSVDHITSFFNMLRTELAFYVGCLNLYDQLTQMVEPVSFPIPAAPKERRHSFKGLYDACLALTLKQKVVGNDINADSKDIMIITGANQGGKSTFLRSVGLAQLMMQCGMFVPAESFCANICDGIFTHYRREEDSAMNSGKLDEELSRMSGIVDNLSPNAIVLFNESFAATNEREGSEIARQIICALLEKQIKIVFVTHLYEFAHSLFDKNLDNAIFLRAGRQHDGKRTFELAQGEPLKTSFGEDLYQKIFEETI